MEQNVIKSVILGHAVGDALGVPVEFQGRKELEASPVTDMTGYGTYPYPKGTWSDDTSMSLCALDSLAKGSFDKNEIMENFCKWLYRGEYTPTGEMFDVGTTSLTAIENYFSGSCTVDECGLCDGMSNGNGSLMRINPFVLYLAEKDMSLDEKLGVIHSASALTHAHRRSLVGCGIYALVLWAVLEKQEKSSIFEGLLRAEKYYDGESELSAYSRLFRKDFRFLHTEEIRSSGYVVDTLEAAIWCVLTTENYREAVLKATNLGSDTDTVAAVAGGIAGALYGLSDIPEGWLSSLLKRDYIEAMCERMSETSKTEKAVDNGH